MNTQTVQSPKVIRRYQNRKLYDVETSKYTSLKEIVTFVTSGREVQIIDNKTKSDITGKTLVMALVETEQDLAGQANVVADILKAGGLTKYAVGLKNSVENS